MVYNQYFNDNSENRGTINLKGRFQCGEDIIWNNLFLLLKLRLMFMLLFKKETSEYDELCE